MSEEAPKLSPSLTILKFLVIAMGITMIVGFLFLLGVIYKTVGKEKKDECVATSITLESGHHIRSLTSEQKGQLSLLLESADGKQSVAIIDSCNGKVLRHFSIEPHNAKD